MSNMTIQLTSPSGNTLKTAGKYCEEDIAVVPVLQDKTVTENGTYTSDDGYAGFNVVTVDVSGGSGGGGEEWIGDGNTHLWIRLDEGRTSPLIGVGVKGTATVDWGDGTTPDVLTATNTAFTVWTPHEYTKGGNYVVTLSVDGEMRLLGTGSSPGGSALMRYSSSFSDYLNSTYRNRMYKVEIGNGVVIGDNAFYVCHALSSVYIPDGITQISNNSFYDCHSLSNIYIPSSVKSLLGGAFHSCYGMKVYDFTAHTAVPTLSSTTVFNSISADCEIRVPAALVDEWKAATNWSTYASYIVGV